MSSLKVVSLVPSQTELLYYLGLREEVVGITKFCVHPHDWFREKKRVGGTKNVHLDEVRAMQPNLVLANKEENIKTEIEAIMEYCPAYVSDVFDLDSALGMITDVGRLVAKNAAAKALCDEVTKAFDTLTFSRTYRTAYLIWQEPYMTIGGDTFISDMMERCGFLNLFKSDIRYPVVTIDQLNEMNCELLMLSSEPYPFQQKHLEELQPHLPNTKIILADGEMFSWYGSRLLLAVEYFKQLISGLE